MTRFAFIIHPLDAKDIARRYAWAKWLPSRWVEHLASSRSPSIVSHVRGIKSITGSETEGWFIGLPMTPYEMIHGRPLDYVYERIIQCAEMGAKEGAKIIGLGAFTSVVGDGGITVAKSSPIAVTTGNSYTVATAIEGALDAAARVGIDQSNARLAVVGATGSIGATCARAMAPGFSSTLLIGRDQAKTQRLVEGIPRSEATTDYSRIREADVVITVTSSDTAVILPEHLRSGSVVCDVARPRDVSVRVAKERPDVLVIEGGVVAVPGNVEFGIDFGFPPRTAYACMSETMMLALENRIENFTLGKDVSLEQVEETQRLAKKHGFTLQSYRSFEREVDEKAIDRVRDARIKTQSSRAAVTA